MAINEYTVLLFRDQALINEEQLALARRFNGLSHTNTSVAGVGKEPLRQRSVVGRVECRESVGSLSRTTAAT